MNANIACSACYGTGYGVDGKPCPCGCRAAPLPAAPAPTEVEKLAKRLTEMGATIRGFTPGSNPNATPEQIAAAISGALDEIEAGAASSKQRATDEEIAEWVDRYDLSNQLKGDARAAFEDAATLYLTRATPSDEQAGELPPLPQPMRKVYERPHGLMELEYYTANQMHAFRAEGIAALAVRQAPTDFLMPADAWNEYATRSGLLNEHGVAPDPAKTQAAYFAYMGAWNRLHAAFTAYIAQRRHLISIGPARQVSAPDAGMDAADVRDTARLVWCFHNFSFDEAGLEVPFGLSKEQHYAALRDAIDAALEQEKTS